ncbi:hypothetical protein GF380_04770 [Candidatus Uhrbacteria bacterium]|nr:hypothetical protein [Candidatus Uhrbacteria bacterium]
MGNTSGCDHAYFPLREGYSVTFASPVEGFGDAGYTMTVTDSSDHTATLDYDFTQGDTIFNQELECKDGQIRALSYFNGAGAVSFDVETVSAEGEILPADLGPGKEWTSTYEIVMKSTDPNMPESLRNFNASVTMQRKALGEEEVTVPAGTYTALQVETVVDFAMETEFPIDFGYEGTEYWVKGVGLVKSVAGEIQSEAVSITLP